MVLFSLMKSEKWRILHFSVKSLPMIGEDLGVVRGLLLHGKRGLGELSKYLLVLFEKNRLFKYTNSHDLFSRSCYP